MFLTNYDYNGSSGEFYNEIYTYDKTWNESSWVAADGIDGGNEQLATGINTNNFFIQKYGADFVEYRGMGWMNDRWRRPNQKRNGGVSVGITASPGGTGGSSPMEYTNGSHPRYIYLGNKLVGVCLHCIPHVGLPTCKAVFMGSNGATLEYDIDYWDDETGGPQGTKGANWIGWIDSSGQTGTTAQHGEGRGRQGIDPSKFTAASLNWAGAGGGGVAASGSSGGDGLVFLLKTDPEDDGVPPQKTCAIFDATYNPDGVTLCIGGIVLTGQGVMMPMHNIIKINKTQTFQFSYSYGGPLSGDNAIIWSGDSGTSNWIYAGGTHGWLPWAQAWSSAFSPNHIKRLQKIFPDYGYSVITLDPADNQSIIPEYVNKQGGPVGYTAGVTAGLTLGNKLFYNTVNATVIATGPYGGSPEQNRIEATTSIKYTDFGENASAPVINDTQLYVNDGQSPYVIVGEAFGSGKTLQVAYDAEYCSMTLKPLSNINEGTYQAGSASYFVASNGTIVGGDGPHTVQQVYNELVPLIGMTGEMVVDYYNNLGLSTLRDTWFVEGFTSGTGGFSFDQATTEVSFPMEGTATDRGVTYGLTWSLWFNDPYEVIALNKQGVTLSVSGLTASSYAGKTLGYLVNVASRWSINDKMGGLQSDRYPVSYLGTVNIDP